MQFFINMKRVALRGICPISIFVLIWNVWKKKKIVSERSVYISTILVGVFCSRPGGWFSETAAIAREIQPGCERKRNFETVWIDHGAPRAGPYLIGSERDHISFSRHMHAMSFECSWCHRRTFSKGFAIPPTTVDVALCWFHSISMQYVKTSWTNFLTKDTLGCFFAISAELLRSALGSSWAIWLRSCDRLKMFSDKSRF